MAGKRREPALTALLTLVLLAGTAWAAVMPDTVYPKHNVYWTGRIKKHKDTYRVQNCEIFYSRFPPDSSWQGYSMFDLSEIPNGSQIRRATMYYRCIQVTDPCPPSHITIMNISPADSHRHSPERVWQEIVEGDVASGERPHPTGWIDRVINDDGLAAIEDGLLKDWVSFGFHKIDTSDTRANVDGALNWTYRPFIVLDYEPVNDLPDLGVVEVFLPGGTVLPGHRFNPAATVENCAEKDVPFRAHFIVNMPTEEGRRGEEVYRAYVDVSGLAPGQTADITFPECVADGPMGTWWGRCSLEVIDDRNPTNDQVVDWFTVGVTPHPLGKWGWEEVEPIPLATSTKPVRRGAWLTYDQGSGYIYAGKGNKTGEFFRYAPLLDEWTELSPVPFGDERRTTGKGTRAACDGKGNLYLVKGNNSFAFWRYDIEADEWSELWPVLPGHSEKKVKQGCDAIYVEIDYVPYIYLLKGKGTDFLRYNIPCDSWEILPDAPTGARAKWDKGSWLCWDGNRTIYAHKAKYHELWTFDVIEGTWSSAPLSGIPYMGEQLRSKASRDGSGASWYGDRLYCMKGGKTNEFWCYDPLSNVWSELDSLPQFGSTLLKRGVKDGGDFVCYGPAGVFYVLKGYKTREFWTYRLSPLVHDRQPGMARAGVAGQAVAGRAWFTIATNPARPGQAAVKYTRKATVPAELTVRDVCGRVVMKRTLADDRGTVGLGQLGQGVYLVSLDCAGRNQAAKLVVAD